jgi:hypothetical protein
MPPELPVIYENPRFDAATPTLQPVINRAIRFGAVLMIEWGTLTLIEDAPRYVKIATIVIAVLVLAVHESWPWLRMRNKRLYPALMGALITVYVAIFGYALFTETPKSHSVSAPTEPIAAAIPSGPTAKPAFVDNPRITWDGGAGPVVFDAAYARTGGRLDIYIEWGIMLERGPVVGLYLNWDGSRHLVDSKDRSVSKAALKTTIGTMIEDQGQFTFQVGQENLKFNITDSSMIFRLVFVSQEGEEQSYLFALIPARGLNGKQMPAIIVDPNVFTGRGNM